MMGNWIELFCFKVGFYLKKKCRGGLDEGFTKNDLDSQLFKAACNAFTHTHTHKKKLFTFSS